MSAAEIISEAPKLTLKEKREIIHAMREAIEDEMDIAAADAAYQRYLDGEPTMDAKEFFKQRGL